MSEKFEKVILQFKSQISAFHKIQISFIFVWADHEKQNSLAAVERCSMSCRGQCCCIASAQRSFTCIFLHTEGLLGGFWVWEWKEPSNFCLWKWLSFSCFASYDLTNDLHSAAYVNSLAYSPQCFEIQRANPHIPRLPKRWNNAVNTLTTEWHVPLSPHMHI